MPIRLSRPALAALGLLQVIRGHGAAGAGSASEDNNADHKGLPAFDDLVETGEEVYDEFLLQAKKRRDHIETDFKNSLSKLLADLGLATQDEIRNLREQMVQDNPAPTVQDPPLAGNEGSIE